MVEVPASSAGGEPTIKLYPDVDGHVGRIEVYNRQGDLLGALTRGASAFAIRAGRRPLIAAPFRILPEIAARDRGLAEQLFNVHNIGRSAAEPAAAVAHPDLRLPDILPGQNNGRGRQRGGLRENLERLNPFRRGGTARNAKRRLNRRTEFARRLNDPVAVEQKRRDAGEPAAAFLVVGRGRPAHNADDRGAACGVEGGRTGIAGAGA